MSKDRRLGRGLAALLGSPLPGDAEQLDGPQAGSPAPATASQPIAGPPVANDVAPLAVAPTPGSTAPQLTSPPPSAEPTTLDDPRATAAREDSDRDDPNRDNSDAGEHEHPATIRIANLPDDSALSPVGEGEGGMFMLEVESIDDNPFQPRREFNEPEIASLAESLKEHDMLQPLLVRRRGERYQLISGERRLRAAVAAGWSSVPVRLRDADDRLVAELAIVENLQRKDLSPIEKALSFRRYLEEHNSTQGELAKRLKIDRSTIANLMRLLELPDQVLNALRDEEISAGHARALLPLGDDRQQITFAIRIKSEGLSVRAVEDMVRDRIRQEDGDPLSGGGGKKPGPTKSEQVAALEQEFRSALGTKVDIRTTAQGKRGKIVVHFKNHDEFERLRALGGTRHVAGTPGALILAGH